MIFFFSGLLRPDSSNSLLGNFRVFLSLNKKLEELQQELYQYILAKHSTDSQTIEKWRNESCYLTCLTIDVKGSTRLPQHHVAKGKHL